MAADAKRDGKLSLIVPPGDFYKQVADAFQTVGGNGTADIAPRVAAERKAGQYLWDAIMHSPGSQFQGLKPVGALDPAGSVRSPARAST